jgi:hypothetical protein
MGGKRTECKLDLQCKLLRSFSSFWNMVKKIIFIVVSWKYVVCVDGACLVGGNRYIVEEKQKLH